jgi:hypothetical protein
MFDDLNQKNNKVEDIFSGTEMPAKPDILKPKESFSVSAIKPDPDQIASTDKKQGMKKILFLAILIIAVILIIFGVFWILKKIDSSLNEAPPVNQNQEVAVDETNQEENRILPLPAEEDITPNANLFFPSEELMSLDSDQDGLSDEEESAIGTSSNNIDTDNDGLFDREEVRVYKTNPLVSDTDGDGYSDGDEVKNGYNPAGAGKLYEISN